MATVETKMKLAIKKEIRKQVKISGSHLGTIKRAFEINFPSYSWEDWKGFAESVMANKFNGVQASIRSTVRYQ